MSRQPTWDTACRLQGEMFREAGAIGGLDVQLVYFRGLSECRASRWVSDGAGLGNLMGRIACVGGHTQILKVLKHARKECERAKVQALVYVGNTVAVDGSKAQFDGSATWNLKAPKDTSATITITNSAGQTVYSGNYSLQQGNASFVWDGKGNDGVQYPKGTYSLSATGKDSSGNNVAISTEVQGVVDSVDLTASPPLLSIGGTTYTTDQIKRVVRTSSSSS